MSFSIKVTVPPTEPPWNTGNCKLTLRCPTAQERSVELREAGFCLKSPTLLLLPEAPLQHWDRKPTETGPEVENNCFLYPKSHLAFPGRMGLAPVLAQGGQTQAWELLGQSLSPDPPAAALGSQQGRAHCPRHSARLAVLTCHSRLCINRTLPKVPFVTFQHSEKKEY